MTDSPTVREPLLAPFPIPSALVVGALDDLRLAVERPPEDRDELRLVAELPRPWDPPTCPPELQHYLWRWLADVVLWINEEHTWRVDRLIPICWAEHPHIAHELATLACQRFNAMYAVTPDPLEEWHRFALPAFLDRIAQRVGPTGCPPGRHQPSPGEARHVAYRLYRSSTGRSSA
jgi:hypothetical protein